MGVKQFKPTSPGRRFQTVSDFAEITTSTPEKSLLTPLPKKAGRNNKGCIAAQHNLTRILAHCGGCVQVGKAKILSCTYPYFPL